MLIVPIGRKHGQDVRRIAPACQWLGGAHKHHVLSRGLAQAGVVHAGDFPAGYGLTIPSSTLLSILKRGYSP